MGRLRLVLVRHGETDLNRQGRVQGLNADPLNALGRVQADSIAEAVAADMPFDLYASPVPRALETASVVSSRLGVSVTRLDPVREADAGELVGLTGEEMRRRYPAFMERWAADAGTARMPGGESMEEVRLRAWRAVDRLRSGHPHDTVVVVAHNQTIGAIVATALDMPLLHFQRLSFALGSITRLDLTEARPMLVSLNETCHLPKARPPDHAGGR